MRVDYYHFESHLSSFLSPSLRHLILSSRSLHLSCVSFFPLFVPLFICSVSAARRIRTIETKTYEIFIGNNKREQRALRARLNVLSDSCLRSPSFFFSFLPLRIYKMKQSVLSACRLYLIPFLLSVLHTDTLRLPL